MTPIFSLFQPDIDVYLTSCLVLIFWTPSFITSGANLHNPGFQAFNFYMKLLLATVDPVIQYKFNPKTNRFVRKSFAWLYHRATKEKWSISATSESPKPVQTRQKGSVFEKKPSASVKGDKIVQSLHMLDMQTTRKYLSEIDRISAQKANLRGSITL